VAVVEIVGIIVVVVLLQLILLKAEDDELLMESWLKIKSYILYIFAVYARIDL
jgi:hypothetical protein